MTVSPDELLARYAVESSYFRANGTVRHNAFMPARDNNTSVFRISDLNDEEVWEIGDLHVTPNRGKPVIARAEIISRHVFDQNLDIDADDNPPRHANINGWPENPRRKLIAIKLAANAQLIKKED